MNDLHCKLAVIGGGPGGYVCASRAAQFGVDTILIESGELGGTCLNVGCIPSKALIHAADLFATARQQAKSGTHGITVADPVLDFGETRDWMDGVTGRLRSGVAGMLERAGVKSLSGRARFLDGKSVEVHGETGVTRIHAENIVIATGSRPATLPGLPLGGKVLDSTGALALREVPPRMAVIGAGYIGLELGTAFAKLGSAVTLIDVAPTILSQFDRELTRPVLRRLGQLGVTLKLDTSVIGWTEASGQLQLRDADGPHMLDVDQVLVTVGRIPNFDGLALEELNLHMDGNCVQVDDQCRTSMRGIFAIGDVTPGLMLAHRASAQAEIVADVVAGRTNAWNKVCVPAICFTDPEIVSVGLQPDEARALGAATVSQYAFSANGRARTLDTTDGFLRIVARQADHVILGVQATGPGVSEMLAGFTQAIEVGLRAEDIAAVIHPHPTLSEVFQEAALSMTSIANNI